MSKPDLLLLHGALGASSQFAPLTPLLDNRYNVYTIDLIGHGPRQMRDPVFRMDGFVHDVLNWLDTTNLPCAHIFGYSMGGYVACLTAASHPDKVLSIATLGTKFYWDPETAARERGFMDPAKMKEKVPHFAGALEARHTGTGWENVLSATADLLTSLGETGGLRVPLLSQVQCPVRVMVGDRDRTVGVPETYEVYRALPQGQLAVLPATPHELERVQPELLVHALATFVKE